MNVGWKAVRHTAPFAWNQPQNEQELSGAGLIEQFSSVP